MLRLLEHYPSVQGEGPRVGIPTQFVRFAGCNLKCPAWPCDTQHAIDPKQYRQKQELIPVRLAEPRLTFDGGLISRIIDMRNETGASNICLTGGEPMLQKADELLDLSMSLTDNWKMNVEMFSNGTIAYPDELIDYVDFVVDWKLPGSGEDHLDATRLENVAQLYNSAMPERHAIKFTVIDYDDMYVMQKMIEQYDLANETPGYDSPWLIIGKVWNGQLTDAQIVAFILENRLPLRLTVQMHNYVWDPQEKLR